MGVDIAKVDLYKRVQTVKADMISVAHNSSPGQVESTDELWTRIYHTISEMETQLYDLSK